MKFWRNWHRWLGLIVGLQVLLWVSGGVVMSLIPIDLVRGQHLVERTEFSENLITAPILASNSHLDLKHWRDLKWLNRNGQAILKATSFGGQQHFLDSRGVHLEPLSIDEVNQIAQQQYTQQAGIARTTLLKTVPSEVKHLSAPVYQVVFDDLISTTFYVSPLSGQVESVRSDIWRFYDFFWMLHIMDYQARSDFNNPLLIAAALVSLLFSGSGLYLVYLTLVKPKFLKLIYRSKQFTVSERKQSES